MDAESPTVLLRDPSAGARRERLPGGHVDTYYFPGRWMDDATLADLRAQLADVACHRLGGLPAYGVFRPGRAAFANRIVTLLFRDGECAPCAFSAAVHCPVDDGGRTVDVLNLGLTVARPGAGGGGRLRGVYVRPLWQYLAGRLLRPFWVAAFTSRPQAFGAIADGFTDVYPHYRDARSASPAHLRIARALFERWRGESGVASAATFDDASFVVRGSCGAGPSEMLRRRFEELPGHRAAAANAFCRRALDYERGDELLVLGRADFAAAVRFAASCLRRRR